MKALLSWARAAQVAGLLMAALADWGLGRWSVGYGLAVAAIATTIIWIVEEIKEAEKEGGPR